MDAVIALHDVPPGTQQVDALFADLAGHRLLLAVSGGADSVAMMGLVAGWAMRHGHAAPDVAVVDHGLRQASAEEAAFVAASAKSLGLPCAVLTWQGAKPASGLQEAARMARYRLLAGHAGAVDATMLVTAHTLDDQAETVMMRMARGSGVTGLGGMRARSVTNGLAHARPFLSVPKSQMIATCRHHGWDWVDDPSNGNMLFARVRWRGVMPVLAHEGLSAARLGTLARRMAEADEALHVMSQDALLAAGFEAGSDAWHLDAGVLATLPFAVAVRVVGHAVHQAALRDLAASDAPMLRLDRLERLTTAFLDCVRAGCALRRSLAGQVVTLDRQGHLSGQVEGVRARGRVNRVHISDLGKVPGET